MTTTTTAPDRTAEELLVSLFLKGYTRGVPAHVSAETAYLDDRLCRRSRCQCCGRRGMMCKPLKRGASYRVIACCPSCGAGEER